MVGNRVSRVSTKSKPTSRLRIYARLQNFEIYILKRAQSMVRKLKNTPTPRPWSSDTFHTRSEIATDALNCILTQITDSIEALRWEHAKEREQLKQHLIAEENDRKRKPFTL